MPADALYAMFPDTRGSYPDECIINADTLNENAVLAFHKIFEEASINAPNRLGVYYLQSYNSSPYEKHTSFITKFRHYYSSALIYFIEFQKEFDA